MFILLALFLVALLRETSTFHVAAPLQHYYRASSRQHQLYPPGRSTRRQKTELNGIFRRLKKAFSGSKEVVSAGDSLSAFTVAPPSLQTVTKKRRALVTSESVDICVVGGGVSGLTAALTAAEKLGNTTSKKILLLEASDSYGGRVRSDITDDGYVLDRGFAVFIESYPAARDLLDYEALQLKRFLPGALVKIPGESDLARVADPIRQPEDLFTALTAPVGTFLDKLYVLSLIVHVTLSSVDGLFAEEETTTLHSLKERWGFSDNMIERFFKPFLEGIYLAPLDEQSSRMFLFVFKMFTEGYAALPKGGMGVVASQLVDKVKCVGVETRLGQVVTGIQATDDVFLVKSNQGMIQADSVILASDGTVAQRQISQLDGFESLQDMPEQKQRSVGCLYYSFKGPPPVQDPILILNGNGDERGNEANPVNNVCFPSVVNEYAPQGFGICSVTVLQNAMGLYANRLTELDIAVRNQLSTWFPEASDEILTTWKLERIYEIPNAQPAQLGGPWPANVNSVRDCSVFRNMTLPKGFLVCGDHMATATLNGALASGVKAGNAAVESLIVV